MELIRNWFQDWSDSCEYAGECVPDFSVLAPHAPYSAFAAFAAACFCIWWWNERQLKRLHACERQAQLGDGRKAAQPATLDRVLDQMKTVGPEPKKQAA